MEVWLGKLHIYKDVLGEVYDERNWVFVRDAAGKWHMFREELAGGELKESYEDMQQVVDEETCESCDKVTGPCLIGGSCSMSSGAATCFACCGLKQMVLHEDICVHEKRLIAEHGIGMNMGKEEDNA